MRRNRNISSHAVGQRSQSNDNFTNQEVSHIADNVDSQTDTNILQESCELGSGSLHRQFNEHHQSNHHNNQVPTDQFVMNRPNVAPDLRHVFVDPSTNRLNLLRYNANSNRALVPAAESSVTNNSRTDYARSRVPRLHQSSSRLGKAVIKQEPAENTRDHPRLFRPTPYRLNDSRFAAVGLPVDPLLRALTRNPNSSTEKVASDEISTANTIRTDRARSGVPILHQSSSRSGTDYARSGVPILHQSSSRSGKEVKQEHGQSRRDHPQVTRPIMNSLYDPCYATIGLPVDPILRAFKQNPNFSKPKATNGESSTSNNTRNHYALSEVPRLHRSSHSEREVAEQQHTQSRIDTPRVIRRIPYRLYDPRYAAIGQPVDPLLRAFKQNPNWHLPKREE